MGNKIDTQDILGERVICSDATWFGHIVAGHPIMRNNLQAVKNAIEVPEAVYKSSTDENRKVYFKSTSSSSYEMYTKVVTQSVSDDKSEIVSAWPQKSIKGGIGVEIYHE